jgi:hypothetical protein
MCVTRFSRVMRFCLLNVVTHDGKSLGNKRKAPRAAVALREEPSPRMVVVKNSVSRRSCQTLGRPC